MTLNSKDRKIPLFLFCCCSVLTTLLIAFLTVCPIAQAQTTTADLIGRVTDPTGAVVPGAVVTITNLDTHDVRKFPAGPSGDFTFSLLPIGRYSVLVAASTFKTYELDLVTLQAGDRTRVDVGLQIGGSTETVEVHTAPPTLQTDNSTVGSTVDEQTVQEIPLNGRNYINLVQTQPGVNIGPTNSLASGQRPDDRRQTSAFSANGQSDILNNQMIDGMDNNERFQGFSGVRPAIDAIAEVKVDTNAYSAEVGRSAGGVVNVITKSGTNQFHGTLYEFIRNEITDANNFFQKRATNPVAAKRPKYIQNQFGGSLGGFIVRNRTFFFGDVESQRRVQGTPTGILSVPTAYQQAHPGDFSDVGGRNLNALGIALDPIALKYFALYPAPNVASTTGTNNYINSPKTIQNNLTYDLRVDQRFSDRDSSFVRFSYNPVYTFVGAPFPVVGGIIPGGGQTNGPSNDDSTGLQLSHVHTFTPSLLLQVQAAYTRIAISSLNANAGSNVSSSFGMPRVNVDAFTTGLASFTATNYTGLGDSAFTPIFNTNNIFQYQAKVIYTKGTHTLHIGGGLIRRQDNYFQSTSGLGSFSFTSSNSADIASSLENFLQGKPFSITRSNQLVTQYMRVWEPYAYAQDDWHVNNALTLNLGLRYEVFTPITEKNHNLVNFDLGTLSLRQASSSDPSAGVKTDYSDISPRIGFAASLPGKTVLRGGFGISYYPGDINNALNLPNPSSYNSPAFSCQPAQTTGPQACPAGVGKFSQGPPLPVAGSLTAPSGTITAKDFNYRASYIEQFNLLMQKEIKQTVLTVGYIGELGRRQLVRPNLDQPDPSPVAAKNPLVYQTQLPSVTGITFYTNHGYASYHAFQAVIDRRFSKGLVMNVNYNYARGLNNWINASGTNNVGQLPRNLSYDYGNSDIDLRHRIAGTVSYALPFSRPGGGIVNNLIKDYHLNLLGYWQTGLPFTVADGAFPGTAPINLPNSVSDRPNRVPGASYSLPHPSLTQFFNTSAFVVQPLGTPGNEGRNQLYGPRRRQVDLSMTRDITVHDGLKLQLRAEVFNLTNTANFSNPGSTFTKVVAPGGGNGLPGGIPDATGTTFGQITATAPNAAARQMQFAAKLKF